MKKSVLNAVVLTLCIAALAVVGCGKDKKEGGDEAKGAAGAPSVKDGPGAARAKATGGGGLKTAFALFPKESNMIAGINISALRGTALWSKFTPMLQEQAGDDFKEFTATCGIDPLNAIDTIIVGGNVKDDKNMVIVVKGNLDKAKVLECAKKISAKENSDLKIEEDGQIVGFIEGDDSMYVAWLDDGTIVTGPGAEGNKDWLKGVLSGGASVADNKELMDLVNNTDSGSSLWFAMIPPADDNPFAAMGGPAPMAMFGSIELSKGLKLDAGLRYAKADDAKMLADQANQMMGPMKSDPTFGKYLNKTSVSTSGNDMIIKVDLNQAELDELTKMVEQQLPMLMMMAGGM